MVDGQCLLDRAGCRRRAEQEYAPGVVVSRYVELYERARADALLGPVFNGAIKDWDRHLDTMDDFWSSALLGTQRYKSAPFPPHLKLDMGQEHFDRWRDVWIPSCEATLPEPLKARAINMAEHMSHC